LLRHRGLDARAEIDLARKDGRGAGGVNRQKGIDFGHGERLDGRAFRQGVERRAAERERHDERAGAGLSRSRRESSKAVLMAPSSCVIGGAPTRRE